MIPQTGESLFIDTRLPKGEVPLCFWPIKTHQVLSFAGFVSLSKLRESGAAKAGGFSAASIWKIEKKIK